MTKRATCSNDVRASSCTRVAAVTLAATLTLLLQVAGTHASEVAAQQNPLSRPYQRSAEMLRNQDTFPLASDIRSFVAVQHMVATTIELSGRRPRSAAGS
jgi:hypothetical protein